jgi:hypothetical protein
MRPRGDSSDNTALDDDADRRRVAVDHRLLGVVLALELRDRGLGGPHARGNDRLREPPRLAVRDELAERCTPTLRRSNQLPELRVERRRLLHDLAREVLLVGHDRSMRNFFTGRPPAAVR